MVASDAIGMGLNLNIRRIIFHRLCKHDGAQQACRSTAYSTRLTAAQVAIPVSQVLQIAGRAGRRNSQYSKGKVTCRHRQDLPHLTSAMQTPAEDLVADQAGLFPEFEQLEVGGS